MAGFSLSHGFHKVCTLTFQIDPQSSQQSVRKLQNDNSYEEEEDISMNSRV